MKKLLIAFAVIGMLSACSTADQAIVDAMAADMCEIMEKLDIEDPMGLMEIAGEMMALSTKEGYDTVSEIQFKEAMKSACPEGLKKFEDLENM